jgi:hypothetical protein
VLDSIHKLFDEEMDDDERKEKIDKLMKIINPKAEKDDGEMVSEGLRYRKRGRAKPLSAKRLAEAVKPKPATPKLSRESFSRLLEGKLPATQRTSDLREQVAALGRADRQRRAVANGPRFNHAVPVLVR